MKITKLLLSFAVVGLLFASCDDTKKKEAEAKAEAEKTEMEAKAQAEKEEAMAKAEFEKNTIAAVAMGNENFTTLVSALKAAGLAETFMGEGEFTVFAPTNDAFAKVPEATLKSLLQEENKETLQNLLKYHVVAGEWKADAVIKAIKENDNKYNVTTLQGENVVLSLKDDKVMITDANGKTSTVVMADVDASNGVIHAIDTVVMPKA
ncbi:fasciclin domain-containing protein [Patiriisocius hiemis]|uniref:Fasciclin domain-containing protein n=1 Tax=Patiriisocius hiemis TaxID=3075604 RepID=A0ABU2YAC6_9FLAO|nr:fasciclin domain-containing protein [Constantimarinum sp. W242]MDT0554687.1 fasciclin domain-containing protein [Constantimarinum sp. W242]